MASPRAKRRRKRPKVAAHATGGSTVSPVKWLWVILLLLFLGFGGVIVVGIFWD